MKRKLPRKTAISLALFAILPTAVPLEAFDGSARRSLVDALPPVVEIEVTPEPPTALFVFEEEVPDGCLPVRISHAGVFDSWSGKIKWGPIIGGDEVVLSYALLGPQGTWPADGTGIFGYYPVAVAREARGTGTLETPSPYSSYESWALASFGSEGFRGPRAAPDHRPGAGVPNAVAFAAAAPPGTQASDLVSFSWSDGPPPVVTMEVERNAAAEDVPLRIWHSFDLAQWFEWDPDDPALEIEPVSGERERLSLPVVPDASAVFVRFSTEGEPGP